VRAGGEGSDAASARPGASGSVFAEALLAALPAAVAVVEGDGTVRYASAGVRGLVGLEPEELVGLSFFRFLEPAEAEAIRSLLAYARLAPPETVMGPTRVPYRHPDGSQRLAEVWSCNRTGDPAIGGVLALFLYESAHDYFDQVLDVVAQGQELDLALSLLARALRGHPVLAECCFVLWERDVPRVLRAPDAPELPAPPLRGPWDEVRRTGVAVELVSLESLPPPTREAAFAAGLRSVFVYPVEGGPERRAAASLVVWQREAAPLTINQRAIIDRARTIAAVALGRTLAEDRLRQAAFEDMLTGVGNRRRFFELAGSGLAARGAPALLYVDLDDFKQVNDEHGHLAGDEVLAVAARRLAAAVRPSDEVARLGGDEFAVLLAAPVTLEQAVAVARRIVEAVAAPIALEDGRIVAIGASVGIAYGRGPGESLDDLLRRADRALYLAKASGKARWHVLGPEEAGPGDA
jgi:diguanylate cyclase (GGDEF)-like protein/PAS domain S-box-containing protein